MAFLATVSPDCRKSKAQQLRSSLVETRTDHVTPLLKELHWLPLPQRYIIETMQLIFKTLNGQGPMYLKELLPRKSNRKDLRSSAEGFLDVLRTYAMYGDRAFSVFCPRHWNDLPPDIRFCTSVNSFKSALKTQLFTIAFK